ncbi:MAG: threonine dehydratase [Luteitalea sp.]|nr:threonine dehydratase [Luteitalea sp.]
MRPTLHPPTLADVFRARARLNGRLPRTPLLSHPTLVEELGCDIRIKHENHLPTGAFKVRGGLNLVSTLVETDPGMPVITASTGNHGQSMALACRQYGVPCTILVPRGNNPEKNAAMRALGAEVVAYGRDFDEAREELERRAATGTMRYVHSANEPLLIAGVAIYALEIFEELPDVDVIYVPIGGGSGASGLVTVRDVLGSRARIIGVQAAGADAFARSWRTGERVTSTHANTFAEGMATRVTFDLTFGILAKGLADVVTLTEEELADGVRLALRTTHNLAEGAGAAALMAAWKQRDALRGQRVVCVMSGGNLTLPTLARIATS